MPPECPPPCSTMVPGLKLSVAARTQSTNQYRRRLGVLLPRPKFTYVLTHPCITTSCSEPCRVQMLAECGLCLALDDPEYKKGGILTTASAMGMPLVDRLNKAGMTFKIED